MDRTYILHRIYTSENSAIHRLAACIQAGVPFQTVLIEGVKHETWTTIDTGKTRSAGDVFGIMGLPRKLPLWLNITL